jgi:hypothetical protein
MAKRTAPASKAKASPKKPAKPAAKATATKTKSAVTKPRSAATAKTKVATKPRSAATAKTKAANGSKAGPTVTTAKTNGKVSTKTATAKADGKSATKVAASRKRADTPSRGLAATPSNDNAPSMIGTLASESVIAADALPTIAPRGVFLPDRVVVDLEGDTFPSTKLDEHGRDEAILPGTTLEQIRQVAAEGQRLVDGDPINAFRRFRSALELLPQPQENWNAAGWLLVAMGEAAIRAGDFNRAFAPLKDAMHCPGTIGNPWVHLRLGQARLELADDRAVDDLSRAYMGGGRAVFDGLDPKYFAVVEGALKPPPGHDRLP